MEKGKTGVCTTCNMTEGSSCSKWCAGCTLHKVLRVVIMVVALCAAYSFGQQVGIIKSMLMSGDSFMPRHNMMYRGNWENNDQMMIQGTAPMMQAAPATPAPTTSTTTKPAVKK